MFTRDDEQREIQTDARYIGALAVLSESPGKIDTDAGADSNRPGVSDDLLSASANLEPRASLGGKLLRGLYPAGSDNRNMILDGAETPPSFDLFRQRTLDDERVEQRSWTEWLGTASPDQLTNFSQWYTQRLELLSRPDSRAELTQDIKADFIRRLDSAIDGGWIDPRHRVDLLRRVDQAQIRFFSPFGKLPEHVGGLTHRTDPSLVMLPTVAGVGMTTHELGHVLGSMNVESIKEYFEEALGKVQTLPRIEAMVELHSLVDEGIVEHLTEALLQGHPETVDPVDRDKLAIPKTPGSSLGYRENRRTLAKLLGGSRGIVTKNDVHDLTDCLIEGDFRAFAGLLQRKWAGKDVLVELLQELESERARGLYQVEAPFSFEPRPPQPDNPFLSVTKS